MNKKYLLKQYGNYIYLKTTTRDAKTNLIRCISFIADSVADKRMASRFNQEELDWMLENCKEITYEEV